MTSNFLIVEKSPKTPAKIHIIFKIRCLKFQVGVRNSRIRC